MSLRRGVSTLAVALTTAAAGATPAAAYVFDTNQPEPPVPTLVHQRNLAVGAPASRRHKHGSGGSQRPGAGGPGKRNGLPTGRS